MIQEGLAGGSADSLWKILTNLPAETTSTYRQKVPDIPLRRGEFCLVANTRSKLLHHVCRTLVSMVDIPSTTDAATLGCLLVISQVSPEIFREDLTATLESVRELKTFKFKGLLEHVTQIELLEELLYLASKTDVKLELDGVNKRRAGKEDIVKLLKGHVTACKENSEETVLNFLMKNREMVESQFTAGGEGEDE